MFDETRTIALIQAIKVAPQWSKAEDIVDTAEKFLAFLNDEKTTDDSIVITVNNGA
jgi:hypothetical protein